MIPKDVKFKARLLNLAKSGARTLLQKAGGLQGVRYWNRKGFRILMYHNFPSSVPGLQDALAKQCEHMARYYQLVSMADIARFLREGMPLPPNALAVTVDDGYRDFLLNGFPVFHAHKIPVTVFLVSGFIDRTLWLWWDQIRYLVEKSRRSTFQLSFFAGEPPMKVALETAREREQTILKMTETFKNVNDATRRDLVNKLPKILEADLPREAPLDRAPLEWSEVRRLANNGVDFGAHSVSHPVLSRIGDEEGQFREIAHSRQRIEEELGRQVQHFCYPNGRLQDFNELTLKVVEKCRFHTASTVVGGINFSGVHPHRLKRIPVESIMPDFYFHELLAGLHGNG